MQVKKRIIDDCIIVRQMEEDALMPHLNNHTYPNIKNYRQITKLQICQSSGNKAMTHIQY